MCDLSTDNFKTQNYFFQNVEHPETPLWVLAQGCNEMRWNCAKLRVWWPWFCSWHNSWLAVTLSTCLYLMVPPSFFNCKMRELGFMLKIPSHFKISWGGKVVKRNGKISLLKRYRIKLSSPKYPFSGRDSMWPQNWWVADPRLQWLFHEF